MPLTLLLRPRRCPPPDDDALEEEDLPAFLCAYVRRCFFFGRRLLGAKEAGHTARAGTRNGARRTEGENGVSSVQTRPEQLPLHETNPRQEQAFQAIKQGRQSGKRMVVPTS